MWQALRSDLKEFVAVVTDPNNSKDGDDDDREEEEEEVSPALEEALHRMGLDETYTQPLLDLGTDVDESTDIDSVAQKEGQDFIDSFSLDLYEEEIAAALETHGETLQPILQRLVPEVVSRKDFWMRYFFHCSLDRIQQEIAEQESRERFDRMSESLRGVKSFFGGAVQSVANSILEDDEGGFPAISPFHMNSAGTRRPPFVMNTAVDEDDDEENEALGWSDDEDEDAEAQIEFKDAATERLQEQLKQALEERDMLHQTVELQQTQIAELSDASRSLNTGDDVEQLKMQLFELESELAAFRSKEMDSPAPKEKRDSAVSFTELEALRAENTRLRAALDDNSLGVSQTKVPGKPASNLVSQEAKENEVIQLRASLKLKQKQLAESTETYEQRLSEAKAENARLTASLTLLEATSKESQAVHEAELAELRLAKDKELAEAVSALEANIAQLKVDKEAELLELRQIHETETMTLKESLQSLEKENLKLVATLGSKEAELIELRRLKESHNKQIDSDCGESESTPGSAAKVEVEDTAAPIVRRTHSKTDDGSDDWGDDWGDEDD
jgi:hypothetical protein